MDPYKKDEGDERKDSFEKIFEEMMRKVDEMMYNELKRNPFDETEEPGRNKDITFSFSISPGPNSLIETGQEEKQPPQNPEGRISDIIDGEKEMKVLLHMPDKKEDEIRTILKKDKIIIKAPGLMKELSLPQKGSEIKEETYNNGVLELRVLKKD